MLESVVAQWAGSTPLKKAKCRIVVYSIDEFIPSRLSGCPHFQLGRCCALSAGLPGRPGRGVGSADSESFDGHQSLIRILKQGVSWLLWLHASE